MAKWYANGTQNNAYIEWEKPYIQQKRQSFGCLFLFRTIECSQSLHSIVRGCILLRVLEFFVFRKMEMPETKNHLLCGWRQSFVQKNHLSVTIELFRHYCKKGKVILWRIRIMI